MEYGQNIVSIQRYSRFHKQSTAHMEHPTAGKKKYYKNSHKSVRKRKAKDSIIHTATAGREIKNP
jgi:hypothetical protein